MSTETAHTALVTHNNARSDTNVETTADGVPTTDGLAEIFAVTDIDPPRAVLRRAQHNLASEASDDGPDLADQQYIHGYDPVDDMAELRREAMAVGRSLPPHPDDDRDAEETERFEEYQESVAALVELADLTAGLAPASPVWDEPLDLGCSHVSPNIVCGHYGACGHDLDHRAELRELDPDTWEYRAKLIPRAANALQAVWWNLGLRPDPRREIARAKRRVEDVQDMIDAELDRDHNT